MAELPAAKRARYLSLGLPHADVIILADELATANFFDAAMAAGAPPKAAANWIMGDIMAACKVCVRVCVCVRMCAHVCMCVCARPGSLVWAQHNQPPLAPRCVSNTVRRTTHTHMHMHMHTRARPLALQEKKAGMDALALTPAALAEMIALIDEGVISGKIAKDVLPRLLEGAGNGGVRGFVEAEGLVQISGWRVKNGVCACGACGLRARRAPTAARCHAHPHAVRAARVQTTRPWRPWWTACWRPTRSSWRSTAAARPSWPASSRARS
jgi:hypothetical protein